MPQVFCAALEHATVEHPYPAGRMARVQQPATSSPFGLDIDGMCTYIYVCMYIYMLNGWLMVV